MICTKYKFTPQDVAGYLFLENVSHKRENEILSDLFKNHNQMIVWNDRNDYLLFKQSVMNLLNLYELDDREYQEVGLILLETAQTASNTEREADYFGAYFKLIWLQLMYSGISYRKIKLKNLLRDFGYKRRTASLIYHVNQTLNAIGLKTYLRDHEECDISDAGLDDMIMIRLAIKM